MRSLAAAFVVALACSSSAPHPAGGPGGGAAGGPAPRMDLHCTPQDDFDEAACAARGDGCGYGPPLVCSGVDDPEGREGERRAYEAGTAPCTCVCPADVRACAMVP